MSRHEAKKSETLEVRLSYETKRAIQEQATKEELTLSALVRHVLDQYLEKQAKLAKLEWPSKSFKTLIRRPRLLATSTASMLAMAIASQTVSHAQAVALQIKGQLIEKNKHIAFDKDCRIDIGESCEIKVVEPSGLLIRAERLQGKESDKNQLIRVKLNILREEEKDGEIIMTPVMNPILQTALSETGMIEVGVRDESIFRISIKPERLKATH